MGTTKLRSSIKIIKEVSTPHPRPVGPHTHLSDRNRNRSREEEGERDQTLTVQPAQVALHYRAHMKSLKPWIPLSCWRERGPSWSSCLHERSPSLSPCPCSSLRSLLILPWPIKSCKKAEADFSHALTEWIPLYLTWNRYSWASLRHLTWNKTLFPKLSLPHKSRLRMGKGISVQ